MLRSIPFLLFDGDCAEAMTFYHQALGGELTLTRLADTPMKSQFPPEKHDRIINAYLVSDGVELSATDWMASPELEPVPGNMSAVFITANTDQELEKAFDGLSQGAREEWFQPLRPMPFGTYGQFYDKYGVQWIFRGDKREYGRST